MPIYEYECPKCGRFEVVQKFSDKPLKCDPDCKEKNCPKTAERVMSAAAFHLKGTGWYKTDYAKKPAPVESKSEPGASSASSTETKSSSEPKKESSSSEKSSGGSSSDSSKGN